MIKQTYGIRWFSLYDRLYFFDLLSLYYTYDRQQDTLSSYKNYNDNEDMYVCMYVFTCIFSIWSLNHICI